MQPAMMIARKRDDGRRHRAVEVRGKDHDDPHQNAHREYLEALLKRHKGRGADRADCDADRDHGLKNGGL